ncbi:hypothetical protein U3516DRAFT_873320 [Neocallimastix sp. 'constans']
MGFICPGYNSIKFQVTRNKRKQLPPDITTFDEIPNESKYYKAKRDEIFIIFKNNDLIAFQSHSNQNYFLKIYFCGWHILYCIYIYLSKIKKNSSKYNSIEIMPKTFHCEFEKAMFNAAEKVFINSDRNSKKKKNELYDNKVERIKDLYIFIIKIFRNENWNYYDNIEHLTNNVSESFNKYLKKLFSKKPTFFQLLSELQKKESKYYIDYERIIAGILKNNKQKKLISTEEIKALIKYYKNMEILLKKKIKALEMISLNYG